MIKIDNLKKSFGEKEILKGVNLEIKGGACTAILGFSGGGKSTIIKHIVGLLKPDSGAIWYKNKDITKLDNDSLRDIRKDIGYLFQSGALFDSMNVFDNVAFPLREHTNLTKQEIKDKVMHYLELVGLDAKRVAYLEKSELSGGMQKRVGLARTIILDPKIILYDEPTSGLDPVTSDLISQMIISLQEKIKTTSILISHDIKEIFKTAQYFAMLYDGEIVEYGNENEFANSNIDVVHRFLDGNSKGFFS